MIELIYQILFKAGIGEGTFRRDFSSLFSETSYADMVAKESSVQDFDQGY